MAREMTRSELEQLWSETLRSENLAQADLDRLAAGTADLYNQGDAGFREHIANRSKQVAERTGRTMQLENFGRQDARAYVADEIGFGSWDRLLDAVDNTGGNARPLLFEYTVAAMERGDFSALESAIGPAAFHGRIVAWHESGLFDTEQETLAEVLSAACMLGQTETAEYLIKQGVDPYAGMRSWLAGPHYAVSSGRLEMVRMLIGKKVPMEVENRYGGTLLGQALWSAVNEHKNTHAEIIELLIAAGARVWPETSEWWEKQDVPSAETKERVREALKRPREPDFITFHKD